jgi:hypothetical protein
VFGKKTAPLDPPGVPYVYAYSTPVGGTGGVKLTCTPPARTGNDFVGDVSKPSDVYLWYEIQKSSDNGTSWSAVTEGIGNTEWRNAILNIFGVETSFFGLTPAASYRFRARAMNTIGAGPYSAASPQVFIPITVN